ncbi:MAG: N-6 DNA methylase [Planctomycetaceae bacterium]|nr:N-6 DNA methylase [Planctomycetaceae bacterium]
MQTLILQENKRLEFQTLKDKERSLKERNRLGQFATPPVLAEEIVRYVLSLSDVNPAKIRFFDPAFGTGAFYSAFLKMMKNRSFQQACGIEIDPAYFEAAEHVWGQSHLRLECGDFTRLTPPEEQEKFNFVVCNPPYVRHHHISPEDKKRHQNFADHLGIKLSGLAGLYCYFMLYTDAWLEKNGLSAWLIPGEFLDVNYGTGIKKYLKERVSLLRIHRFSPDDVQFTDALVSSAVVVFKKVRPSGDHNAEFSFGGGIFHPQERHEVPIHQLSINGKWSKLLGKKSNTASKTVLLGDLFEIKRGLATGDNRFFILSREELEQHQLDHREDFFTPILPSPRFMRQTIIESDENGIPVLDNPLFLLNCSLPLATIRWNHPQLVKYLEQGEKEGIHHKYLCVHRQPWYSQEKRSPAMFYCSYIGRFSKHREHPFRFILNHSNAIVTNSYLAMYPKQELSVKLQDKDNQLFLLDFLNSLPPETLLNEGRVYGGGMYKLEPKEMAEVDVTSAAEKLGMLQDVSRQAMLF